MFLNDPTRPCLGLSGRGESSLDSTDSVANTMATITILNSQDLCRFMKNQAAEPITKLRKLSKSWLVVDWMDEDETRDVVTALPMVLVDAVPQLSHCHGADFESLTSLNRMTNEWGNYKSKVLDELSIVLAIALDPRRYDTYRWHSCDAAQEGFREEFDKMVVKAAAYLRPFIDDLAKELHECTEEFPPLEGLKLLTNYLMKYEHLFVGWENQNGEKERDKQRWLDIKVVIERLLRTEDAPKTHLDEASRHIYWLIRLFGHEWCRRSFEMLLLVFTFNSVHVYLDLDKQEMTDLDEELLSVHLFTLQQGIWFIDNEEKKSDDRYLSDEEMIKLLEQLDKGHMYVWDYIETCLERNIPILPKIRDMFMKTFCFFARYGNIAEVDKKYRPILSDWLFTNAIDMLRTVNDDNVQESINSVEILLCNASDLTELNTKVGVLMADYLGFEYDEKMKGVDIGKEHTMNLLSQDGSNLLEREGWFTQESLQRAVQNAQRYRVASYADKLSKFLTSPMKRHPSGSASRHTVNSF